MRAVELTEYGFPGYTLYEDGKLIGPDGKEVKATPQGPDRMPSVRIKLPKGQGVKVMRLHRLVAMVFVPNPDPDKYKVVQHKDGNVFNNHCTNLEWTDKYHSIKRDQIIYGLIVGMRVDEIQYRYKVSRQYIESVYHEYRDKIEAKRKEYGVPPRDDISRRLLSE